MNGERGMNETIRKRREEREIYRDRELEEGGEGKGIDEG